MNMNGAEKTLETNDSADFQSEDINLIHFGRGIGALGHVLVGWTKRGIRYVAMGDDPAHLERDLRKRLSRFPLIDVDTEVSSGAKEVIEIIRILETPERSHDVALDLRGTDFQSSVWRALLDIPLGRTASYSEIARAIGRPGSARAVASACAANLIAVLVPCHRVVGSDGTLTGYRWGIERKKMLLALEARVDASFDSV